jgi:hypothetical protein
MIAELLGAGAAKALLDTLLTVGSSFPLYPVPAYFAQVRAVQIDMDG